MNPRWVPRSLGPLFLGLALSGCVTITTLEEPAPILPTAMGAEELAMYAPPSQTPSSTSIPVQASATATATATVQATFTPSPTATPRVYTVVEGDTLSVIAKKHEIALSALAAANNLTDTDALQIGTQLIIPSADQIVQVEAQLGTPIPTPQTEQGHLIHYVRMGETLSAIASLYSIDRTDLLLANGLRPDVQLVAGDTLVVPQGVYTPVPTGTVPPATAVPTLVLDATPPATSEPVEAAATPTPAPRTHTVQAGDIAGVIARDNGITLAELAAANPGVNMDSLRIGDTLVIPPSANAAPADASTPEPVTLSPTATPTPLPAVMVTHVVAEGETFESVATAYAVPVEELKASNVGTEGEPAPDTVLQVPLGTPTPTASPTAAPTATPTATPEFLAPIPLLPLEGSTWVEEEGQAPLQLVWTSVGILEAEQFYVVRLRALDADGDVLWAVTKWMRGPSWKVDEELLASLEGTVTLRWDVMVMRRTSEPNERPLQGVALSDKSPTNTFTFIKSD